MPSCAAIGVDRMFLFPQITIGIIPVLRAAAQQAACAVLMLVFLAAASGDGGLCCRACGPGCIDFWMISTRGVPCRGDFASALDRIAIFHCEPAGWVRYTREQFLAATDSDVPITFYVHGIFSNERLAINQARDLFGNVGASLPPFRGVLWTWPSDFVPGVSVRDQMEQANAATQSQAFYMASFIDSLAARVPVSLVGHSLGCRTVAATLHGLAARQIAGQPLAEPAFAAPRPIQAALIAPAIDPISLWPGGEYGSAINQVQRFLITYNPDDRVLRLFEKFFDGRAVGLRGLPRPARGAEAFAKVRQVNANPAVGKRHFPSAYFDSPIVATSLRGFVGYLDEPRFAPAAPQP